MKTVRYIVDTPRFFHCYGQAAARAALVAADGTEYSTMVTAVCGNGVEFGIKIASLPGTAPAAVLSVSARTGSGIPALEAAVAALFPQGEAETGSAAKRKG